MKYDNLASFLIVDKQHARFESTGFMSWMIKRCSLTHSYVLDLPPQPSNTIIGMLPPPSNSGK